MCCIPVLNTFMHIVMVQPGENRMVSVPIHTKTKTDYIEYLAAIAESTLEELHTYEAKRANLTEAINLIGKVEYPVPMDSVLRMSSEIADLDLEIEKRKRTLKRAVPVDSIINELGTSFFCHVHRKYPISTDTLLFELRLNQIDGDECCFEYPSQDGSENRLICVKLNLFQSEIGVFRYGYTDIIDAILYYIYPRSFYEKCTG